MDNFSEPKKLSARFDRIYSEISTKRYNFNRDELEVKELQKLTREDIVKFFDDYIATNGTEKKKISTHVISQLTSEDDGKSSDVEVDFADIQIHNANVFKFSLPLFPTVQPFLDINELSRN